MDSVVLDIDSVVIMDSGLLDEDVLEDFEEGISTTAATAIITMTTTTATTAVVETPRLVRMSVIRTYFLYKG
jgi:hypothetical protein